MYTPQPILQVLHQSLRERGYAEKAPQGCPAALWPQDHSLPSGRTRMTQKHCHTWYDTKYSFLYSPVHLLWM